MLSSCRENEERGRSFYLQLGLFYLRLVFVADGELAGLCLSALRPSRVNLREIFRFSHRF